MLCCAVLCCVVLCCVVLCCIVFSDWIEAVRRCGREGSGSGFNGWVVLF